MATCVVVIYPKRLQRDICEMLFKTNGAFKKLLNSGRCVLRVRSGPGRWVVFIIIIKKKKAPRMPCGFPQTFFQMTNISPCCVTGAWTTPSIKYIWSSGCSEAVVAESPPGRTRTRLRRRRRFRAYVALFPDSNQVVPAGVARRVHLRPATLVPPDGGVYV